MPKNCAVILTKSTSVWLHLPAPPAHRVYRTIEDQRGIALPISIRSCWSARCKTTNSGSMPEITALPIQPLHAAPPSCHWDAPTMIPWSPPVSRFQSIAICRREMKATKAELALGWAALRRRPGGERERIAADKVGKLSQGFGGCACRIWLTGVGAQKEHGGAPNRKA